VNLNFVRKGFVFAVSALLLAVTAPSVAAQTGQVTGRVVNASTGAPLSGAQIVVAGTAIGTLSNAQGRYLLLNAPAGAQTIEVTRLGYAVTAVDVVVTAGETVVADIRMEEEVISLDEVVVTGTAGSSRRREIGNTVGVINQDKLEAMPVMSATDVLQAQTPGLVIRNTGGAVGNGSEIMLRGVNTLGGPNSNRPLIYVDGVRIESGSHQQADEASAQATVFDDLDFNNIERIEVVKGAAATTLYGTEAAAGVIQIFTKGGGGGAPQWTATIRQGVSSVGWVGGDKDGPVVDPRWDGEERDLPLGVANTYGLHVNDCTLDPGCPESGSWLKKGYIQEYDMSVRGGDRVPWYFAVNLADQQGNIDPQGAVNMSMRGNFRFEPLNNVSIRMSNMFSRRDITFIADGNNAEGLLLNVMRWERDYTNNEDQNTLDMQMRQQIDHFITGLNITWQPTTALSQRLNVGLDYVTNDYTEERPWGFFYVRDGARENDLALDRNITVDYAGNYTRDLPDFLGGLASTTSWGAQYYDEFSWGINGFGEQFAGPGDKLLQSGVITTANEGWLRVASGGFFLQEQIGWNDRLFVTVGGRWDGFSTFGENFGIAFYPKISAAFTVSDYDFMPDFVNTLKLRAALGESGRAPSPFASKRTWASTSGDDVQPAVILAELGNEDVGPERTEEFEYGFEGAFFDGRFSIDFTGYDQKTYDALLRLPRPASIGTEQAILTNLGRVDNWGLEFSWNASLMTSESFAWSVGGNYWQGENAIRSLGPITDERLQDKPVDAQFGDRVQNRSELGVRPVWEEEYIGPARPTQTWGLNTQMTFAQRLTLDVLGEFQGGHVRQGGTARQNVRRRYWPMCQNVIDAVAAGDFSMYTAAELGLCSYRDAGYGEWTQPGDFFRLRSVSLSYRVPDNWLPAGTNGMTLRAQGRNLWHSTKWPGVDPEGNSYGTAAGWYWSTREYYNLPTPRVLMFSATVNF
jgi:TonB-dependent SusC/RagA subfamily outer membrane receptor